MNEQSGLNAGDLSILVARPQSVVGSPSDMVGNLLVQGIQDGSIPKVAIISSEIDYAKVEERFLAHLTPSMIDPRIVGREEYDTLIAAANNFYNGRPTGMSDEEYDKLLSFVKDKYKEMTTFDFNIFEHIRYDDNQGVARPHIVAFRAPRFKRQFHQYVEFARLLHPEGSVTMLKWDGSSIRAYYNPLTGELTNILTRSGEDRGVDQTGKLRSKVPATVTPGIVAIDFEACTCVEDFGDGCRSKANGLINSKYKQSEVDQYLILIPFTVVTKTPMSVLESFKLAGLEDALELFDESNFIQADCTYKYKGKTIPVDGFVVYHSDYSFELHKFYYAEAKETVIKGVQWNFGDKLNYIPKLVLETVRVQGSNISFVASGGYANMQNQQVGIGARVKVVKSGSTIPFIAEVLEKSTDYGNPTCHYCKSPLKVIGGSHRCSDQNCNGIYKKIAETFLWSIMDKADALRIYTETCQTTFNEELMFQRVSEQNVEISTEIAVSRLINLIGFAGLKGWRLKNITADLIKVLTSDEDAGAKKSWSGLTGNNNAIMVHWSKIIQRIFLNYKKVIKLTA